MSEFAIQKIKHFSSMTIAIFPRCFIEGHHSETSSLKSVHKSKHVADFSFNIKRYVFQSTQMEESLHSELFYSWMLDKRNIKSVAIFGNQLSEVMGRGESVHVAVDRIQVVHFILYFFHGFLETLIDCEELECKKAKHFLLF